jgi:hypothetical protein
VDHDVAGNYSINYDVSDTSGNAAIQVTRTVVVMDTVAPLLELVGVSPTHHEQGSGDYSDAGATATDVAGGNLNNAVVVSGDIVNPNVAGNYVVRYDVSDASGNAAIQITRTVVVADTVGPVIVLAGVSPTYHEQGSGGYSDAGATATDVVDGDVTGNITVSGDIVNPNVAGNYVVRYNVDDAAGNWATTVTRTVIVEDTTAPVITLIGASAINHEQGSGDYVDAGATAADIAEGDLTSGITVSGSVNPNVAGNYSIKYNVSDSSGNAAIQVTRTVVVEDTTAPVITLTGDAMVNHELGSGDYVDAGATAADIAEGDLTSSIAISGSVNPNVAGTYVIRYDASDASGNAAIQVTRTVVVEEAGIKSGLTHRYEFNGNANDALGTLHGQEVGDPTYEVDGLDQALVLGPDDHINLGSTIDLSSSFSVSMWIYRDNTSGDHTFFGAHSNHSSGNCMHVMTKGDDFRFGLYYDDLDHNNSFVAGKWQHIVFGYDISVDKSYIYLDGESATSGTNGPFLAPAGSYDVLIGAWGVGEHDQYTWDGKIDLVCIYENRMISSDEVALLFEMGRNWVDTESGLESKYDFNGNADDTGGGDNDGVPVGSPGFGSDGDRSVMVLDGSSWEDCGRGLDLTAGFTMSAWIKTSEAGRKLLFGEHFSDGANGAFVGIGHSSVGSGRLDYYLNGTRITSSIAVNDNKWHLITATWIPSVELKLYIDGKEAADGVSPATLNRHGSSSFLIGPGLVGSMDETRVYSRALAPWDVNELYESGRYITDELEAQYRFDGNDQGVTLEGGAAYSLAANGSTLVLSGSGDYADLPDIAPTGNAARTIACWVKYAVPNDTSQWVPFVTTGTASTSATFALVSYGGSYGHVGVAGWANDYYPETGTLVNDGEWHHIAATHDGTTLRIYVDGALDNSTAKTYNTSGQNNQVGRHNAVTNAQFNGEIDDVRIWSRALLPREVRALPKVNPTLTLIGDVEVTAEEGSYVEQGVIGLDDSGENISNGVQTSIIEYHPTGSNYTEDLENEGSVGWTHNNVISFVGNKYDDINNIVGGPVFGHIHAPHLGGDIQKTISMGTGVDGWPVVIKGKLYAIDSWDTEFIKVSIDGVEKIHVVIKHQTDVAIYETVTGGEYITDSYLIRDFFDITNDSNRQSAWQEESCIEFEIEHIMSGDTLDLLMSTNITTSNINEESFGFVIDEITRPQQLVGSVDGIGSYSIKYNLSDFTGKNATEIIRQVSVIESSSQLQVIYSVSDIKAIDSHIISLNGFVLPSSAYVVTDGFIEILPNELSSVDIAQAWADGSYIQIVKVK